MQRSLRFFFVLLAIPISIAACTNRTNYQYALRDSVIHSYIKLVDTSGQYDTTELSHQILKGYVENDTKFLKQLQSDISNKSNERENWELWNEDIPLPQMDDLDIDEGYRFIFSILGTPTYKAVTITKKGSSIIFDFVLFSKPYGAERPRVDLHEQRNITSSEWDNLIQKLQDADFWYLKREGRPRGKDGSDLTVIGYQKGNQQDSIPAKYHFVHRFWQSTLDEAYFYVYEKLLDEKYRGW